VRDWVGHYAGALRLCVTVRYRDMLQYVTLMRYGVSRWRVTHSVD